MRIVIKIGTSTLTHGSGHLNIRRVEALCKTLSDIRNAGHELIVYFILPVLALAFGILMKKLLRGGTKTAKTVTKTANPER